MTDDYKKQLIELAKEVELAKSEIRGVKVHRDYSPEWDIFVSKLSYFLGYVIALEKQEDKQ